MKLKLYQQGGGLIYTPFIPGMQGTTTTSSSKSNTSDSESKIDALDKELIALMKGQDLLPSDIDRITKSIVGFQKKASKYAALGDYSSVMPGVYQIQGEILKAQAFKKQSDAIVEKMSNENAGNEVALDVYGRMYVQDKDGNVNTIASSDFDEEKYRPLSNSELLYYRQISVADNGKIFNDLSNIVGMSTISKEIERMIKAIGTKEESEYINANAKVREVLSAIADGPDGIYKLTTKQRSEGLQPAWKAIYDSLPKNMQNVIRANAAIAGTDYRAIIQDMVLRQTDTTVDVNYESTTSKAAGYNTDPNNTSGEQLQAKDTYPERLATGQGFDPEEWINIMPYNTGVTLKAFSQNVGPVVKDENRMNSANLETILLQADGIGTIADAQSITFGDQLLNENDAKMLMVDTNVNMRRVWLPVKYMPDGRVTPDFEAQQKLEKAQQYIRDNNGQISDAYIEDWLKNNLPNARWDSENKQIVFDQSVLKAFLVLHGIGTSKRLNFETSSPYLHNLSREEAGRYKDLYEISINEDSRNGKTGNAKGENISTGNRNKFYSGNIYIPISGSTIASGIHNSQYFSKSTYTDITQKARINEQRQQMKTNW